MSFLYIYRVKCVEMFISYRLAYGYENKGARYDYRNDERPVYMRGRCNDDEA